MHVQAKEDDMATLLVVDDDPVLRALATEHLESVGHTVCVALDGVEAIAVLETLAVDLVVLDMMMPNKDGIETVLDIRRRFPDTRVLAISGGGALGAKSLLHIAETLGADGSLAKPLRRAAFLDKVEELLTDVPQSRRPELERYWAPA